ncbi:MAG: helical backbone metal receptor [Planctomycetota bacterium]|nr:helical backbone metal receptor [Planctomycetota bacterium]
MHPPRGAAQDPRLAKLGGTKKFSREKLLALKPDLVLLNLEENELEDIEFLKARVPCYLNGVRTVEEGIESLRELGALLGALDEAERLARPIEAALAAIRGRVAERAARGGAAPRVFYPIWRDPWMCAGPDTFIAHHLEALGARAVPQPDRPTRYPTLTLAEAAAARPDAAWLPDEPFKFQERDAAEIRAAPGFKAVEVKLVGGDDVCWFGARQAEGLPYAYRTLWGQGPQDGPLPLEVPKRAERKRA